MSRNQKLIRILNDVIGFYEAGYITSFTLQEIKDLREELIKEENKEIRIMRICVYFSICVTLIFLILVIYGKNTLIDISLLLLVGIMFLLIVI